MHILFVSPLDHRESVQLHIMRKAVAFTKVTKTKVFATFSKVIRLIHMLPVHYNV